MPPLRQYAAGQIRMEEQKLQGQAAAAGFQGFVKVSRDQESNIIRDIHNKQADKDFVKKILETPSIEVRYDDKYLKSVTNTFQTSKLPIQTSSALRPTFETYIDLFKRYTEEKEYSGISNLSHFVRSLYEYERDLATQFTDFNSHTYLRDVWELMWFFCKETPAGN